MGQKAEDRYQQIMKQIAERRAQEALAPARAKQDNLGTVLDGLDVLGEMENIVAAGTMMPRANGPGTFSGFKPQTWVGVTLWRRGGGYYGYRVLQIVGVWAIQDTPGPPLIVFGTKRLRYTAPTYEAEAYHKLLRKTFEPYYDGDASPPPETGRQFSTRYASEGRLELRDTLRRLLTQWAAAQ